MSDYARSIVTEYRILTEKFNRVIEEHSQIFKRGEKLTQEQRENFNNMQDRLARLEKKVWQIVLATINSDDGLGKVLKEYKVLSDKFKRTVSLHERMYEQGEEPSSKDKEVLSDLFGKMKVIEKSILRELMDL